MTQLQDTLRRVQNGELSCETATRETLRWIRRDDRYNAFLTVYEEDSLRRACEIDRRLKEGKAGALAGRIIAVKDNICMENKRVTCGSRILEEYVSPYSATVVERLERADAVIIGKTNMDEFAMGSSNENSAFGSVRNPVDPGRVPGGSSGGSAAAVAARLVPAALGSDTGGSIRQPAAFCGVVGLKPTYGRVSRYGLVAFASSLDQIGTLSTTVAGSAEILKVIAGHDPKDSTSADVPVPDYPRLLDGGIQDIRIGYPADFFGEGLDREIRSTITGFIDTLKKDGFTIGEIELPHASYAVAAYYILANAEASSNLARYDGARYGRRNPGAGNLEDMYLQSRSDGFGDEVKRRIILGTYVLSAGYYDAYYRKAQKVRRLIYDDFKKAFAGCDIVVMPATPTPPFNIGEKTDDPLTMYLNDIYTIPVNLAGLPGLAVPCGATSAGLPIGLQLIGRHFEEGTLLRAGHFLEQNYLH